MIKKNNGVTLVMLIVTIVIMIILATFIIDISSDLVKKSNLEDIKTNMLAIQAKARTVKEMNSFDSSKPLLGVEINDSIANETYEEINYTYILEAQLNSLLLGKEKCYVFGKGALTEAGLSNTIPHDTSEFYVVDYGNEQCEIYYSLGFEEVYSLTELKNK